MILNLMPFMHSKIQRGHLVLKWHTYFQILLKNYFFFAYIQVQERVLWHNLRDNQVGNHVHVGLYNQQATAHSTDSSVTINDFGRKSAPHSPLQRTLQCTLSPA